MNEKVLVYDNLPHPLGKQYRILVNFGTYNDWISDVWCGVLQELVIVKRLFRPSVEKWKTVSTWWWDKEFQNELDIQKAAIKIYETDIVKPITKVQLAQNILNTYGKGLSK